MVLRTATGRGLFAIRGGRLARVDRAAVSAAAPLQLRPPTLTNPTTIVVQPTDTNIELGAGDYIIQMPSQPMRHGFNVDGNEQARHVVMIGGAIEQPLRYNLTTMRLDDNSDYKAYATRGFTGATGGTFTIRTAKNTTGPYAGVATAALPWNATPAQIAAAIDAVLGADSVYVDGPSTPGGPWKFVPRDDRLGRPEIILTGLTGTPAQGTRVDYFNQQPFSAQRWTGTFHMEGVFIGGPGCDEAMTVLNPCSDAVLQIASCHLSAPLMSHHDDHHHTDSVQAYLGPTEIRMERTDLVAHGSQVLMAQPRETSWPRKPDRLRDWWFKDCMFEMWAAIGYRTAPYGPGVPIRMEDDYPGDDQDQANWDWRMENCYVLRRSSTGVVDTAATVAQMFYHGGLTPPDGVTYRTPPPGGYFATRGKRQCGIGYVSPGYAGALVDLGTLRLEGETKVVPPPEPPSDATPYDNAVLADAPVVYLPLSANATDLTANGLHGTVAGGATFEGGRLHLTAAGHWVDLPNNALLRPSTAITVELWVEADLITGARRTMWAGSETASLQNFTLTGSQIRAESDTSTTTGPTNAAWTGTPPLATPMHLAFTYDGANLIVYRDGAVIATTAKTGPLQWLVTGQRIGARMTGADQWLGYVSRFALYDRALSAAELADTTLPGNPMLIQRY